VNLLQLTPSLAVLHSRSMAYNSGLLINGDDAVLIDAGLFPEDTDSLRSHIYAHGARPTHLVITHSHWDHVLGPEYFPGVPVIQQNESLAVFSEFGTRIERQVTEWERQSGVHRDMPFLLHEPDETFGDHLEFKVGGKTIELHHAPGHAPEQLVVYDRDEQTLWAADMLSDIEIPFVMHSLKAYRGTLDRLVQLKVTALVPGHGSPVRTHEEVRARFETDRAYLGELQRRVEAAVAAGRGAADAVFDCAEMEYANREQNEEAHRLNVETAFIELGGAADSEHPGWNRFQ